MKTKTNNNDPIVRRVRQWKKDQAIISVTFDELLKLIEDRKFISEQKVDGQTGLMDFYDDGNSFGTLGGVIYSDLPVLDEIKKILKEKGIHQAQIVGEMAGYDNGKIIPFNETESIIKNPKSDKNKVHWFPYQILELDGVKFDTKSFEVYKETWPQLKKMFSGSKHVVHRKV
jgi:ATP-dependent DNA ligase